MVGVCVGGRVRGWAWWAGSWWYRDWLVVARLLVRCVWVGGLAGESLGVRVERRIYYDERVAFRVTSSV